MARLALLAALLAAVTAAGCGDSAAEKEAKARALKKEEQAKAIAEMVSRHGAIQGWEKALKSDLTIDVQEALVNQTGRPVVFHEAHLEDLWMEGDRYVAQFKQYLPEGQRLRLLLTCTSAQCAKLRASAEGCPSWGDYAIVARALSVYKVRYVIGTGMEEELTTDEERGVAVRGELVDFLPEDWP